VLDGRYGVCAGDPSQWRLVLLGDRDQRLGEFGGVSGLLAVHPLPRFLGLGAALCIVLDRQLGISTLRIETLSTCSPKGTPTRRQKAISSIAVVTV
jgi:hypothetical protein